MVNVCVSILTNRIRCHSNLNLLEIDRCDLAIEPYVVWIKIAIVVGSNLVYIGLIKKVAMCRDIRDVTYMDKFCSGYILCTRTKNANITSIPKYKGI